MKLDSQAQQAIEEWDSILSLFVAPQIKECSINKGEVYLTWFPYFSKAAGS